MKTASELLTLGEAYEEKGDYLKAQRLYRKALTIQEKVSGLEDPVLAPFLYNLGFIQCALDNNADATQLLERYIAIQQKQLGNEDEDIAEVRQLIASLSSPLWSSTDPEVSCA